MVRASGLVLAGLVVMLVDGPQIAVSQEVAGDTDMSWIAGGNRGRGNVAK